MILDMKSFRIQTRQIIMQMKRLILFLFRVLCDHQFHAKTKRESKWEKQTFNMNLLNENIIVFMLPTMLSLLLLAWEKGF
jgi:hypothetical protein